VFVTKGQRLPAGLKELANAAGVPLIRTKLKTAEFYRRIKPVLEMEFAPTASLHGSLADVVRRRAFLHGGERHRQIGMRAGFGRARPPTRRKMISSSPASGERRPDWARSRAATALHGNTWRGADSISRRSSGFAPFGNRKRIEVVVELEEWDQHATVERTGLDVQTTTILGVELPRIRYSFNPGKNITVIAEVIALNHLLRLFGHQRRGAFNVAAGRPHEDRARTTFRLITGRS